MRGAIAHMTSLRAALFAYAIAFSLAYRSLSAVAGALLLFGAVLMIAAGIAWGVYSLRGRSAGDATGATAGNFLLRCRLRWC